MLPIDAAPGAKPPADESAVIKAAEQFESLLIRQMLRQMRRSLRELASEDSPFKDKVNDDMLDLADAQVADALAGQRAFGIADALLKQLLPQMRLKSEEAPVASPDRAPF